jgi:hypothetical protein
MSAGIRQLAEAQGFGAEFGALQALRIGLGNPAPDDMLRLPSSFRRAILGADSESDTELARAKQRLVELVEEAPQRERELLRMAFNFDHEFGFANWTTRASDEAVRRGTDERKVRELVDKAILQLLIRTREAAEQYPESSDRQEQPSPGSRTSTAATAAAFFNQDYVRSSQLFVDAWGVAETVDMCGFGHNRMLVAFASEIARVLRSGGLLRVLLQDPEGRAVIDANFRSSTPKASDDAVRHQHRAGLAMLTSLQSTAGAGNVMVRTYDIMPPFTAYFFDAEIEGRAKAFVWFWSWRQASSQRPGFVVVQDHDPLWFDRFYAQFTEMWNDDDVSKAMEPS